MGMRYIDPYQLADKVAESMRDNPHEGKIALNHRLEHEHFLRMIAFTPSADVEPVIHARWIANRICSSCRKELTEWAAQNGYFYCPNCGAKMDKEEV
jgi:hypothetical protein